MRFLFLLIVYVIFTVAVSAQQAKHGSLVAGFGGTSYRGDLTNKFESWGGTFHVGIVFNKNKRVNGYIHLMMGGVRGNNPSYVYNSNITTTATPNNYFKTSLFSIGYELKINIIKKACYSIYASPGIAILRYNPKDEFNNTYYNQFDTRAKGETYSNIALMLPVKIGGAYYLPGGYGIGIDMGFLNPLTDYIDNISMWGNRKKKDNLLQINVLLYIPLKGAGKE